MTTTYCPQIVIHLIFKAVSMIGFLAWHLEIALQLKIRPLGFSALWSVCALRSAFQSGLLLQGHNREKKNHSVSESLTESVHVSLMIFIVASVGHAWCMVLLFWWFVLFPPADTVEADPALIKTVGQLFAGFNSFSEEQKPGMEAKWPQMKLAQPPTT